MPTMFIGALFIKGVAPLFHLVAIFAAVSLPRLCATRSWCTWRAIAWFWIGVCTLHTWRDKCKERLSNVQNRLDWLVWQNHLNTWDKPVPILNLPRWFFFACVLDWRALRDGDDCLCKSRRGKP